MKIPTQGSQMVLREPDFQISKQISNEEINKDLIHEMTTPLEVKGINAPREPMINNIVNKEVLMMISSGVNRMISNDMVNMEVSNGVNAQQQRYGQHGGQQWGQSYGQERYNQPAGQQWGQ
ncbi:MAG: hypothetical protein IPK08_05800 [Bacteroidetes bacterium]|nr:hypothetical protein [Bacteroidota bacterium]